MIVHLSLSGAPSVIAKLLHEDADYMYVEYPVIYMKEETVIYTLPLLPFADKGKVKLSKNNIIATSKPYKDIEKHYGDVVKYMKKQTVSFIRPQVADKLDSESDLESFLSNLNNESSG